MNMPETSIRFMAMRSCLFLFLIAFVSSAFAQTAKPEGVSRLASAPDVMSAAGSSFPNRLDDCPSPQCSGTWTATRAVLKPSRRRVHGALSSKP